MMKILIKKTVFMLLLAGIGLTACEKDKPAPEPDLAVRASGQYTYSEMVFRGQNIPAAETNLKGTITIQKKAFESVDVTLNIRQKATNAEFMVYPVEDVTVSPGENDAVDFFYEGQRVAQLKGSKFYLNGIDESDEPFTLVATK